MYAKLGVLAAIATLWLLATPGQAAPAMGLSNLGSTTAVTRASFDDDEYDVEDAVEQDDEDEDEDEYPEWADEAF